MTEVNADILPLEKKKLRACLLCSLIKTQRQFLREGCDNCDEILRLKGSADRVAVCTSAGFDGMIALTNPPSSWVSKWQRINKFQPGLYAIAVAGQLPDDIIEEDLEPRGLTYRPRDGSAHD